MATTAPIHKNRTTTMGRISGFIANGGLWKDINLSSKIYSATQPLTTLIHWKLEGESGAWKNWKFEDIIKENFLPVNVGDSFGVTWETHWFKIVIDVPAGWAGKEVHLRWNSSSEAALYDTEGQMLQAFSNGFRDEYIIARSWSGSQQLTFYVEMACNDMFGAGDGDQIAPTVNDRTFRLNRAEIAVFERLMYKLHTDLDVLNQIASQLSNDHRGYQAMFCANEMINHIRINEDYEKASEIADAFFAEGNGAKVHRLVTMGHCHIDTAWLWPYEETIRKIARSWISQIGLMREYPDYVFACSSALQYQWLKDYYPDVYSQVKQFVAQGRFVPVGGAWIEMDGNIPSGESFMRQFFYGQRFYQQEFNWTCKEFWLPDTFGYSAQIPQMLKHVGIDYFLTQKMSWSLVNKFPNHNFWWEGIDGSQVLVHFPPGDSYNMNGNVSELLYSVNNSQDKGRANVGIYLYGVGDGGGGPTRNMIEKQKRCQDVDGLPKLVFEGPEYFFKELEKEQNKLSKWVGELYLELHNGTYTTQARIKWYNRKMEFLLREVEHLTTIAVVTKKTTESAYLVDREIVDQCWKDLLLNQFHDILPGSSIELANQRAWEVYYAAWDKLLALRVKYNGLNLGAGTTDKVIFNPLPWDVKTVIFMKPDTGAPPSGQNVQTGVDLKSALGIENEKEGQFRVPGNFSAAIVNLSASGYSTFTPVAPTNQVIYTDSGASMVEYTNGLVRVQINKTGQPNEQISFRDSTGQFQPVFNDRLNKGINGGQFYYYDDVPLYWDAWDVMDYHLETQRLPPYSATTGHENLTGAGQIVGISKFTGTFGNGSKIERYTVIRADTPMIEYYTVVDWKENHKMLKVEFPVDVLSREATFEIQYGHAKRPTHMNTSWDMAKYEVCGHKWMDMSQADKGVTIITDSKYGFHVRDNIIKLSLLKSPKNPDANADLHKHYMYYAVMPHEGSYQEADVIRKSYELNVFGSNNVQLLNTALTTVPVRFATSSNKAVVIEALKVAHDAPSAVVLRLYEAFGGAANTTISLNFDVSQVRECDGMEAPGAVVSHANNSFVSRFTRPFEIKSYLITFS